MQSTSPEMISTVARSPMAVVTCVQRCGPTAAAAVVAVVLGGLVVVVVAVVGAEVEALVELGVVELVVLVLVLLVLVVCVRDRVLVELLVEEELGVLVEEVDSADEEDVAASVDPEPPQPASTRAAASKGAVVPRRRVVGAMPSSSLSGAPRLVTGVPGDKGRVHGRGLRSARTCGRIGQNHLPDPGSAHVTDQTTPPPRRRVLLKLSGEAFGGGKVGVSPDVVRGIADQIATAVREGIEVAIVVGGGNFFRGKQLQEQGMDRTRADYMGMLGTVMNCLALQDFLEDAGIDTRVQTAITMGQVAEAYIPRRAIRHLEKGRVVIFGAGAGMPFFSTDTVSAQRALEIKCDAVLVSKNGVDGVYDSDPRSNPDALRLDRLTYEQALQQDLKVVDAAAFSLCRENGLPMLVFGMEGEGNITRALLGEPIGTLVTAGVTH